jgi:LCP family protein required for cell wall assembly
LGQLYAGNRRLFALFLVPSLIVIALIVYAMRQGPIVFGARFADPAFDLAALVVVVLFGVWRLASVVQAFAAGRQSADRRVVDRAVLAALAVVIVVSHGFVGTVLATTYGATSNVFSSSNDLMAGDLETPLPSATPEQSLDAATPAPSATPTPSGRVTMLFTGVDSASTRDTRSYDSLMVVSYNPKANTVQMVSIPREIAAFPFYWGGRDKASDWITYMPNYLRSGKIKGAPDSNYIALVKEIQFLVGVHIDYWAVMNLQGFVQMVDAIGGIDINAQAVTDPTYDWLDKKHFGVYIKAGQQHLNGAYALAYARSRHSSGGSDYQRAARQQQVMLALLKKMSQPGMIFQLNNLISKVGSNVEVGSTDAAKPFKPSMVADYIADAEAVPANNFTNLVLGPPYTSSISQGLSGGKSSICLNIPMVATQSIKMFGTDSLYYGKAKPANTCP